MRHQMLIHVWKHSAHWACQSNGCGMLRSCAVCSIFPSLFYCDIKNSTHLEISVNYNWLLQINKPCSFHIKDVIVFWCYCCKCTPYKTTRCWWSNGAGFCVVWGRGMLGDAYQICCSDFSCNTVFLNSLQWYRLLNNTGNMKKINKRSNTAKSTTKDMLNDRPVVSWLWFVE